MKEIKAVIRPNKLIPLKEALIKLSGFPGMTVTRVEGCSASSPHEGELSIEEEVTEFSAKLRIEILCPDELAENIFQCIEKTIYTGHKGDGLIWVSSVEKIVFMHSHHKNR